MEMIAHQIKASVSCMRGRFRKSEAHPNDSVSAPPHQVAGVGDHGFGPRYPEVATDPDGAAA